jgi:hypothetical protein
MRGDAVWDKNHVCKCGKKGAWAGCYSDHGMCEECRDKLRDKLKPKHADDIKEAVSILMSNEEETK